MSFTGWLRAAPQFVNEVLHYPAYFFGFDGAIALVLIFAPFAALLIWEARQARTVANEFSVAGKVPAKEPWLAALLNMAAVLVWVAYIAFGWVVNDTIGLGSNALMLMLLALPVLLSGMGYFYLGLRGKQLFVKVALLVGTVLVSYACLFGALLIVFSHMFDGDTPPATLVLFVIGVVLFFGGPVAAAIHAWRMATEQNADQKHLSVRDGAVAESSTS